MAVAVGGPVRNTQKGQPCPKCSLKDQGYQRKRWGGSKGSTGRAVDQELGRAGVKVRLPPGCDAFESIGHCSN